MGFFVEFTVMIVVISCSATASLSNSLCARKLTHNGEMTFSFVVSSNIREIPKEYRDVMNNETDCIVFKDISWDEDVEIQFSPFRIRPVTFFSTIRIVAIHDGIEGLQLTELLTISKISQTKIAGNTIRSFAIIYNKRSGLVSPFIFRAISSRTRSLVCPDLTNEFSAVVCSNGRNLGSECTFQCNDTGLYPSPDLFDKNTQSETLKTFQSSPNPRFFSVCSFAERRRPAWKPEVLTPDYSEFGIKWKDEPVYWKCVDRTVLEDVCLIAPLQAPKLTLVLYPGLFGENIFFYGSGADCKYPITYLLSIFKEEKDGDVVTTTTLPPLPTAMLEFEVMPNIVPNVDTQEVNDGSVDCSVYCKLDPSTGIFTPKCGNYASEVEQFDCLICRYTGSKCAQLDAV